MTSILDYAGDDVIPQLTGEGHRRSPGNPPPLIALRLETTMRQSLPIHVLRWLARLCT